MNIRANFNLLGFAEKCIFYGFIHYLLLVVNCSKTIRKTNTVCVATINLRNRNSVKYMLRSSIKNFQVHLGQPVISFKPIK